MCSDSSGSIQAAMKKLLASRMVTCSEYVEKSVNKKQYSITSRGREVLSGWLETPADFTNTKNMELGKLLFMGLVPAKKRPMLIDKMIIKLEKELSFLLGVKASANEIDGKQQAIDYWNSDPEYYAGIRNITQKSNMNENANEIRYFEITTLQYGMEGIKFTINWLKTLRKKINKIDIKEKKSK